MRELVQEMPIAQPQFLNAPDIPVKHKIVQWQCVGADDDDGGATGATAGVPGSDENCPLRRHPPRRPLRPPIPAPSHRESSRGLPEPRA